MEDMDEDQADVVYQAFDLDYDVAQAFCSHIIPKLVLLFTGETPTTACNLNWRMYMEMMMMTTRGGMMRE